MATHGLGTGSSHEKALGRPMTSKSHDYVSSGSGILLLLTVSFYIASGLLNTSFGSIAALRASNLEISG